MDCGGFSASQQSPFQRFSIFATGQDGLHEVIVRFFEEAFATKAIF